MNTDLDTTVVIPVYNGERYLFAALESIANQSQLPKKIICVDDQSTDGSAALCENFRKNSPVPLEIVQMPINTGGPVIPMTTGINLAETPYVTLLDQDDLMIEDRIQNQCYALASYPNSVACAGMLVRIDSQGDLLKDDFVARTSLAYGEAYSEQHQWGNVFDRRKALQMVFKGGTVVVASSVTIRKTEWERIGGFDTKLKISWDYDFSLRALRDSAVLFVDRPTGYYRIHQNNTSGNSLGTMKEVLSLRTKYLEDVYLGESLRIGKEEIAQTARWISILETDQKKYMDGVRYAWTATRFSPRIESFKCLLRALVKRW